jgi:hypothetical protein
MIIFDTSTESKTYATVSSLEIDIAILVNLKFIWEIVQQLDELVVL